MSLDADVAHNISLIHERIGAAARRAGRPPDEVTLVAVSKTFGADAVRAASRSGQRDFGENKVQEALQKIAETADIAPRWHLIGHLQSNKVRKAAGAFAWIHSVDSVELLQKLDAAAQEADASPHILVQVDLAGERTKFGALVTIARRIVDAALSCARLRLTGLMLLPPWSEDQEETRPWFVRLRELRDEWIAQGVPPDRLRHLSMGMSHDFEAAVEEGSTIVRVGTAIFGKRTVRGT